ncbi:hypothetical protein C7N43_39525 [Sphingobacteriales bacterium UPWRP_1]|nr:hypothetical protein C7N43_39525 [Sphingobacteriales bacterium UPWRP_1]
MASGGAGIVNLSLSDNALGLGDVVNSLFCGFDKRCRREKNRTPDAPDVYNLTFNSQKSGNNTLLVVLVLAAAAIASIFLLK